MRNFYLTLFWIGIYGLSFMDAAGQNVKLTVEECISLGLEHNFRLRAAKADAEEAKAALQQAKDERLPVVQGQASYMRLSDNIPNVDFVFPGIDSTFTLLPFELNRFYSELSLRQPLFAGGRLNRRIEAAGYLAQAANSMEKQEQADVAFLIRQAYWSLYLAIQEQENLKAALDRIEEHLHEVQNRLEEGMLLKNDLLRVQAHRSEILLEQVETRGKERMARLELNQLLGLPSNSRVELMDPGGPGAGLFNREELIEQALAKRPGLKALSERVRAQHAAVQASKSGRLPEIDLVGRYIYARPNQYFFVEQDQFRGTWEAGVALNWNIWSGGRRLSETNQAKARLHSIEANLADLEEQVILEIERQYLELELRREAIEASAENVEAAEEAFRVSGVQFEEGQVLSSELLDAEYAYRSAKTRYAGAVSGYEIAHAAILHAIGQIWDDGI